MMTKNYTTISKTGNYVKIDSTFQADLQESTQQVSSNGSCSQLVAWLYVLAEQCAKRQSSPSSS